MDSWTELSDRQRQFFRTNRADIFKLAVVVMIEAQWCQENLAKYLYPKLLKMTNDTKNFNLLDTVKRLELACNRYEEKQRAVVTINKTADLFSKLKYMMNNSRSITIGDMDTVIRDGLQP